MEYGDVSVIALEGRHSSLIAGGDGIESLARLHSVMDSSLFGFIVLGRLDRLFRRHLGAGGLASLAPVGCRLGRRRLGAG